MKTLLIFAVTLALAGAASAQPTQIEILARYEGIDPAYMKDIRNKMPKDFAMPRITVQSGHRAVTNMTREYGFGLKSGENGVRSSGATISITPTIRGNKIFVTGKNLLCRPDSWQSKSALSPISFSSLETFFEGTVPANRDVTVKLDEHSSARLILKFTLINSDGSPAK
jgi:hypothetical protein